MDHVLEDALMELMQNVRGDRKKYIGIREVLPERMVDNFDVGITTCGMEGCRITIRH